MKNNLFLLFGILFLIASCSKNIDTVPTDDFDIATLEDGQTLSLEQLNYLGFEIEGDFSTMEAHFHKKLDGDAVNNNDRGEQTDQRPSKCGRRDQSCCTTSSYACESTPANRFFRATTCVSYFNIVPQGSARLIMSLRVDGAWVNSISTCINPTIYCEYYDPFSTIVVNGEIVGYICYGPVLDECPHEIRVETFNNWFEQADCQDWTLEHCGTTVKTYHYNGYPHLCDDE